MTGVVTSRDLAGQDVFLVTGDRNWGSTEGLGQPHDDLNVLVTSLRGVPRRSILLQGGARGADRMSRTHWPLVVAGAVVEVPYFSHHRRGGGPTRNRFMLGLLEMFRANGHECRVLAYHRHLPESRGTKDMVEIALEAGFPIVRYPLELTG